MRGSGSTVAALAFLAMAQAAPGSAQQPRICTVSSPTGVLKLDVSMTHVITATNACFPLTHLYRFTVTERGPYDLRVWSSHYYMTFHLLDATGKELMTVSRNRTAQAQLQLEPGTYGLRIEGANAEHFPTEFYARYDMRIGKMNGPAQRRGMPARCPEGVPGHSVPSTLMGNNSRGTLDVEDCWTRSGYAEYIRFDVFRDTALMIKSTASFTVLSYQGRTVGSASSHPDGGYAERLQLKEGGYFLRMESGFRPTPYTLSVMPHDVGTHYSACLRDQKVSTLGVPATVNRRLDDSSCWDAFNTGDIYRLVIRSTASVKFTISSSEGAVELSVMDSTRDTEVELDPKGDEPVSRTMSLEPGVYYLIAETYRMGATYRLSVEGPSGVASTQTSLWSPSARPAAPAATATTATTATSATAVTPGPVSTPPAAVTPARPTTAGGFDYSLGTGSPWSSTSQPSCTQLASSEGHLISVSIPAVCYSPRVNHGLDAVRIEAWFKLMSGSAATTHGGLTFGLESSGDKYLVEIDTSSVLMHRFIASSGTWQTFAPRSPTSAINRGVGAVNNLAIEIRGRSLSVEVNGTVVTRTELATIPTQNAALALNAQTGSVLFTRFRATPIR